MSVIDGLPAGRPGRDDEPTRCLALASWEFERLVLDHPTIGLAILRGLSARLRAKTEPRSTDRTAPRTLPLRRAVAADRHGRLRLHRRRGLDALAQPLGADAGAQSSAVIAS
jgi:CRP-like cAMP-binding protein